MTYAAAILVQRCAVGLGVSHDAAARVAIGAIIAGVVEGMSSLFAPDIHLTSGRGMQ